MTSDLDIYRTANIVLQQFGDDAVDEAKRRAMDLYDKGAETGATTWLRIAAAIMELQKTESDGITH